jgi:hypothetical protein
VQGELQVTCNDPTHTVVYDIFKNGKYSLGTLKLSNDSQINQLSNDGNTIEDIRNIMVAYPCVVYVIEYAVALGFQSFILNREAKTVQSPAYFYPFMRPSFHRAEAILDRELFDALKVHDKTRIAAAASNVAGLDPGNTPGVKRDSRAHAMSQDLTQEEEGQRKVKVAKNNDGVIRRLPTN